MSPLPVDPSDPNRNIYGKDSFPAVDGRNVWTALLDPTQNQNASAVHPYLVLSKEVIVSGNTKLLVAQNFGWPHGSDNGWKGPEFPSGNFENITGKSYSCDQIDLPGDLSTLPGIPGSRPCLFQVDTDPRETIDMAAAGSNPNSQILETVNRLWAILNNTVLTAFCRNLTTGGCMSSPKNLLGPCNTECASDYWKTISGVAGAGPICGVPGCQAEV